MIQYIGMLLTRIRLYVRIWKTKEKNNKTLKMTDEGLKLLKRKSFKTSYVILGVF